MERRRRGIAGEGALPPLALPGAPGAQPALCALKWGPLFGQTITSVGRKQKIQRGTPPDPWLTHATSPCQFPFHTMDDRYLSKGENHIEYKKTTTLKLNFIWGYKLAPKMTIFSIFGLFWSRNKKKIFFLSSYIPIWFSPLQNYLIAFSMNIFSDSKRYFVKIVILIKKYMHFIR